MDFGQYYALAPDIRKVPQSKELVKKLRKWKHKIRLPLKLDSIHYAKLFSLMASEGTTSGEFSIHVPEKEFHDMFRSTLVNLFGKNINEGIRTRESKGFLRSRAPAVIRYILPKYEYIPCLILDNKEYAREYLRVAFEAEGSPIIKGTKRYIKLTRNVNVTDLLLGKINYEVEKRIYVGQLRQDHPHLITKLVLRKPLLLLGEHFLLKNWFNIESKLKLEAIRINKSDRIGKITARWVLFIYADNIDKFIKEIGLISKNKREKLNQMSKITARKAQYSSFNIIINIVDKGIFTRCDFVREMKKKGYVSPQAYLWRYVKYGLIERVAHGKYKIIKNPS